jgi:hypothetical protein
MMGNCTHPATRSLISSFAAEFDIRHSGGNHSRLAVILLTGICD